MEVALQSRVEHLGSQIERLCERLATAGYVFQYPDEVCPGPQADAVHAIARIEREAGEVPLGLKCRRRLKTDPPCRLKSDPGMGPARWLPAVDNSTSLLVLS
jgi:hypothetical protein